jgi:hypothetical protein
MKFQFMLVPTAIVASAVGAPAAQAKIFMGIEQAQQLMFPGATFEQHFISLDQTQFNAIIKDSNVNIYNREVKAWKVSNGGWFIIDQVRGKDDWISYAVSISPEGKVQQVEILECLENYAGITNPDWRAQFYGGKRGAQFENVLIISGSTLSCGQMVSGVKRILSTHALILSQLAG